MDDAIAAAEAKAEGRGAAAAAAGGGALVMGKDGQLYNVQVSRCGRGFVALLCGGWLWTAPLRCARRPRQGLPSGRRSALCSVPPPLCNVQSDEQLAAEAAFRQAMEEQARWLLQQGRCAASPV